MSTYAPLSFTEAFYDPALVDEEQRARFLDAFRTTAAPDEPEHR